MSTEPQFEIENGILTKAIIPIDCTEITLPNTIKAIRYGTLSNQSTLQSIILPDSLELIGPHTFQNCTALQSITIPHSVTSISCQAFAGCSSLQTVSMGDSVTFLGSQIFMDCHALQTVRLSDQLTCIPDQTFAFCYQLTHVELPSELETIGDAAFFYAGFDSHLHLTLPNTVLNIGKQAFANSSISEIDLPKYMEHIGSLAFAYCPHLQRITLPVTCHQLDQYLLGYSNLHHLKQIECIIPNPDILIPHNYLLRYLQSNLPISPLQSFVSRFETEIGAHYLWSCHQHNLHINQYLIHHFLRSLHHNPTPQEIDDFVLRYQQFGLSSSLPHEKDPDLEEIIDQML